MGKSEIIGLQEWLQTPPGLLLHSWTQARFEADVADAFGYHALQLGLPELDTLRANRMPHRWQLLEQHEEWPTAAAAERDGACVADFTALPFAANSIDLVTIPHTLEFSPDPHTTLREVERVLVPEGRLVLCGFNPMSLWGWKQQRAHMWQRFGAGQLYLPAEGEFIAPWRLRDWLRLLGLEVTQHVHGIWRPALRSQSGLQRSAWMDGVGERVCPMLGAVYSLVAIKRVSAMKPLAPAWKMQPRRARPTAVVAGRQSTPTPTPTPLPTAQSCAHPTEST